MERQMTMAKKISYRSHNASFTVVIASPTWRNKSKSWRCFSIPRVTIDRATIVSARRIKAFRASPYSPFSISA